MKLLTIPRLQQSVEITDTVGLPSFTFHRWWDSVASSVENAVNKLFDNLVDLGLLRPDGTINDDRVTTNSIQENAITNTLIDTDAVNNDSIAPQAVTTSSMGENAATIPWLVYNDTVINFVEDAKTEIFSVIVDKELDESLLEVHGQLPLFGGDAVFVEVEYTVENSGGVIASRAFKMKVDGEGQTYLPFSYEHYFDTVDAGEYTVKMYATRRESNTCSTTGQYHMRIREFKR